MIETNNYKFKFRHIFITFSYKCNSNCKKCITRFHRNLNVEMSDKCFENVCHFLQYNKFSGSISIGSGEPLLFPKLEMYVDKLLGINPNIKIRILSNGKLLNKIPTSLVSNDRITWGITFDGFENNELIGLQKNINIEEIKRNVIKLKELIPANNMYLNYTLNAKSEKSLESFIKFCLDKDFCEVYITELRIWQKLKKELELYKPNIKKARFIVDKYIPLFEEKNLMLDFTENEECQTFECYKKGKNSLLIDVDGSVCFCSGREEAIVGNVADKDLYDRLIKLGNALCNTSNSWCERCVTKLNMDNTFSISEEIYNGYNNKR